MTERIVQFSIRFNHDFILKGIDGAQPPGDYAFEREEEVIQGVTWTAYRVISTNIFLPAASKHKSGPQRMVVCDPADLEVAISQDRAKGVM